MRRIITADTMRPKATRRRKKLKRAEASGVLLTFLAAAALVCCGRADRPRLSSAQLRGGNVLLITVDTLRRDRLGAYGSSSGLTPRLDALAAAGMRYEHAFSHVP